MSTTIKNFQKITWYVLNLLVIIAMLAVVGVGMVEDGKASQNQTPSANLPIDPYIYITLEEEGIARVLVILKEQADLSGASNLATKTDKGTFVYQRLTEVAARTQGPLRAYLDSKGANYRAYWIQNMFMVDVDTRLLQEIAQQPGIDRISIFNQPYPDRVGRDLGQFYGEEFGPLPPATTPLASGSGLGDFGTEYGPQPPDNLQTVEWNISRVGADDAWAIGVNGTGAVVGDLDTGVQWEHPALINHYRGWNGSSADHNYNWFDGVGGSAVPVDYDGHGTHTMGTIVGDDGAGNQIGMAPGAKWMACPGIGSPYVGPFECFQFFLAPTDLNGNNPRPDLAPHVISNSWSSAGTDFLPAIQALYEAGIFFSKSAGNTGPACSTITNPGQWPEVTATAAFAQGDAIASFSSRGPVLLGHDFYVKPDIAAPGVNIRSSYPDNTYSYLQGTSMACPHVTGAVALLISANPELAGRIDILQMILKMNAEPKIDAQCTPFVDHPNDVWGWGILNAYAAVVMAQNMAVGNIEGVVEDSTTMTPISDTNLTFTDVITPWNFFTTSDANGYFLRDLPASTYDILASHYGYLDNTVSNVVVNGGVTVTQDIALTPAPIWEVSGSVVDSMSGGPLSASIVFENTPVTAATDPSTGLYAVDVAQGIWWMDASSPGHTGQSRQVTVDQNLTANFILDPIENYYMHRSVDGACGPVFNWMDAMTGGTPRPLGDDANVYVTLPSGRSFTFYGNSYSAIYVGSNGIATFGLGDSKWSGPIPDPATPNNGIYAFSMDLNPNNGSQGNIYTQFMDNRYFVIEWYQVQHYPSGNPETFEIILDLDTNQIIIQYQTVSDPTGAVSGIENSDGSVATQYAYSDPALIANNDAVTFYPQFGTPPPTGGAGELLGVVTDAGTSAPIAGATISAVAYTGGAVFTYTTDMSGTYSAPLCADWYTTSAEAVGYNPVLDVNVTVLGGAQTVQDYALTPICIACSNVDFSWTPITPTVGELVTFTGVASGTQPITYTWDFGDGDSGSGAVFAHSFTDTGTFTVTLTVDNCAGIPVIKEYVIMVTPATWEIYLPITLRH